MIESALEKYYKHFGENYPLMITGVMTDKEIIQRINYCIETNKPESMPYYDKDSDY